MFFNSWAGLARTLVVGVIAYFGLILLVRISGKRTLSKMNAFDFIVTVALGSTLATLVLSKDIALAEGMLAIALLILLQFMITFLSVRSKFVSRMVKAEPQLLYYRGEYLWNAMKTERVNQGEIMQAMRSEGMNQADVEAVVLETDGSFSVVKKIPGGETTVLSNVSGANR
jgi:uncharacterized membrane protein YcaP (DUF421 family)